MVAFDERDDRRERYGKPRERFSHPGRRSQALATSGAGIVHRNMMDLQRQPNLSGGDVDRLKSLRRDWNRNRKYTDAGMAIAGATTPMEAQDAYVGMSRDLRQGNKAAYNKMYPLTGGFMDYADKGGIWGSLLSNLAKSKILDPVVSAGSAIIGRDGIGGAVPPEEATEEVLKNYANKTFNIHADEPWPHVDEEVIEETTQDGNLISDELWESIRDFDPGTIGGPGNINIHAGEDITVPPWLLDPSLPMPEELTEGEYLPGKYHDKLIKKEVRAPLADYDDSAHEFGMGIGKFFKEMPESMKPDWEDYLEYVERLGDMPGGKLTYDEWHRMMRRRR